MVFAFATGSAGRRTTVMRPDPSRKQLLEYVSMHVKDDIGNNYTVEDSIKAIEKLAELDERVIWQLTTNSGMRQRRFLATSRRIYLLSPHDRESNSEIIDSVPMHEIERISIIGPGVRFHGSAEQPLDTTQSALATHEDVLSQRLNIVDVENAFEIQTRKDGFNQGCTFYFSADTAQSRDCSIDIIKKCSAAARRSFERNNVLATFQERARKMYQKQAFQGCVVLAITANFFVTLAESETGTDGSNSCPNGTQSASQTSYGLQVQNSYEHVDAAFTVIFLAELLFNFIAHAFWPFFWSGWNLFDCVVVLTSFVFLFVSSMNNGLVKLLRILRVFRALRAFGRIGQLREIVNAITKAIFPASQALLIGLIVVAIYATIGSQYFAEEYPAGFCDFYHSFYTMFSIVAYQSPDGLAPFTSSGGIRPGQLAFIYSYICIVVFVFLQVVVAVLLDSFNTARQQDREEVAREAAMQVRPHDTAQYPLDPLLERMVAAFDTGDDLDQSFDEAFRSFDVDQTGSLSFSEFFTGIYKLHHAKLTYEQFEKYTDSFKICNSNRELEPEHFRRLMRRQLRIFTQRKMAESLFVTNLGADQVSLLTTLKLAMIELDCLQGEMASLQQDLDKQTALEEKLRQQGYAMDQVMISVGQCERLSVRPFGANRSQL